jgi:hypothetical protein
VKDVIDFFNEHADEWDSLQKPGDPALIRKIFKLACFRPDDTVRGLWRTLSACGLVNVLIQDQREDGVGQVPRGDRRNRRRGTRPGRPRRFS